MRLLFDPTAEGGSTSPAPTPAVTPPVPVPPPAGPPMASLPVAELDNLRNQLREIEDAKAREVEAAREKHEASLVEKGRVDEILKIRNSTITELTESVASKVREIEAIRRSTQGFVLGKELGEAIASRTDLAEGAASKLTKLLAGDFQAKQDGDNWSVRTLDGRTPEEHIKAYLALPENALFLRAGTRGGAGGTEGGQRAAATGSAAAPAKTMGEQMLERHRQGNAGVSPLLAKYRTN